MGSHNVINIRSASPNTLGGALITKIATIGSLEVYWTDEMSINFIHTTSILHEPYNCFVALSSSISFFSKL